MERAKTPDRFRQDVCRKDHKPRRIGFIVDFAQGSVGKSEQNRIKSLDNFLRQQPHKQDSHSRKDNCSKKQFFFDSRKGGLINIVCTFKNISGIEKQLPQTFGDSAIDRRNIIQKRFGTVTQQRRNLKFRQYDKKQLFI